MENYVLHFDFHAIDVKDVGLIIGYPWMESLGKINFNVSEKFIKL